MAFSCLAITDQCCQLRLDPTERHGKQRSDMKFSTGLLNFPKDAVPWSLSLSKNEYWSSSIRVWRLWACCRWMPWFRESADVGQPGSYQALASTLRFLLWGLLLALLPNSICLAEQASFFGFSIAWDDNRDSIIDMAPRVLEAPAGRRGHVVARGDKLHFEDGTPVRFFGVGIAFSGGSPLNIPPDRATARVIARKLAKYGFNHVRFVGFDATAPEVYQAWKRTGKLDCETMDRFEYFVNELRDAGIYYSVSINNSAVLLLDSLEGVHPNSSAPTKHRRYNHIRLYDEKAIAEQVAWYRAFFNHKNPYTGHSLAKDPANIYIAAVNEDSIFIPYFQNYKHLDSRQRSILNTQFSRFLKRKYMTTNTLRIAWADANRGGLGPAENLQDENIALPSYDQSNRGIFSVRRNRDAMEFLIGVETSFYSRIRAVLNSVGYRGLFTGTNNWYGYGSLYANHISGSYIDVHGYFDHPRRNPLLPDSELITNREYLAGPPTNRDEYPLRRAFLSAMQDRPLLISEWNHSAWSDYVYEGPILTMAYASFQGYSGLDAHTYFNHPNPDPHEEVGKNSFTVSTNPVLMALAPSLSLAYLKGYIAEPKETLLLGIADPGNRLLDLAATVTPETESKSEPAERLGYTQKIRRVFSDRDSSVASGVSEIDYWATSTGEIVWDFRNSRSAKFTVDTPKFKSAAGHLSGAGFAGKGFSVTLAEPGAVTVISLDNHPLAESKSILVTSVSSYRNDGMMFYDLAGNRTLRSLGTSPTRLKYVRGQLVLHTRNRVPPVIRAVLADGQYQDVTDTQISPAGQGNSLSIALGTVPSPWYWISFP